MHNPESLSLDMVDLSHVLTRLSVLNDRSTVKVVAGRGYGSCAITLSLEAGCAQTNVIFAVEPLPRRRHLYYEVELMLVSWRLSQYQGVETSVMEMKQCHGDEAIAGFVAYAMYMPIHTSGWRKASKGFFFAQKNSVELESGTFRFLDQHPTTKPQTHRCCIVPAVEVLANPIQIPNSATTVTTNDSAAFAADKVNDGVVQNATKQWGSGDCDCCSALHRPSWVQLTLVERVIVFGPVDELASFTFASIDLYTDKQLATKIILVRTALPATVYTDQAVTVLLATVLGTNVRLGGHIVTVAWQAVTMFLATVLMTELRLAGLRVTVASLRSAILKKYYNALLAVSTAFGVVVEAVAVFIVVFSRRIHRQCVGGTRANIESPSHNTYDDLAQRSMNPSHYDSLPMSTTLARIIRDLNRYII
ncbi:hypothetical protein DPMN_135292 [Dreissena polymorpha]|uniref:Transmembrane protein n=1 Tax=Dreissena polymorpha TaxID=45954 RepID=A0A9D4JGP2_DREPO|nr:hypothetical protein DPMN_135292 [Dreissena polymorpha]